MIKIDNLKLSKENKDILNEYKIELTAIKLKKIDTTVESYIEEQHTYFVLETLDILKKNGRLKGLKAVVAESALARDDRESNPDE